jgi:hypothetical protein
VALPPVPISTIARDIRLHPRMAYQGTFADEASRTKLLKSIPPLVPFRSKYQGAIVVLDWDHRLPTRQLTLRVFTYYDELTHAAGEEAYDDRLEEIGRRDKYPEFDVPDFSEMPADEAYEAEVEPDGTVARCRLTSAWRRDIEEEEGHQAVEIARASGEFARVASQAAGRPRHLGDLEAVSWTPPCETGHPNWTLDVWYLLAYDGRMGSGRSLLVDLIDRRVVAVRDFSVRAA